MKKIIFIAIIIAPIVAAGIGVFIYSNRSTPQPVEQQQPAYVVPALTKGYTNTTYNFSLKMPEDFTANDVQADPDGTPETIVLQDANNNGIQIVVSPFPDDTGGTYTLTKARILQDVPDLEISDEQPLIVGPNYTGLAFKSNNQAFDGASREVWFVFHGNLYQISTYERLDDLLKAIFGTWQFN